MNALSGIALVLALAGLAMSIFSLIIVNRRRR